MKIKIRKPHHFKTSLWSGGTTTQLYIVPPNATYAAQNFRLRISTAKVEVEESKFTALPSIDRKLMILEGEMTINHVGQYSKHLKPFDIDHFSGDWNTNAIGLCTDFNVMVKGIQQSHLYRIEMEANRDYILNPKAPCNALFLYATHGTMNFQIMGDNYRLETGNLMIIEELDISSIVIHSPSRYALVILEMILE